VSVDERKRDEVRATGHADSTILLWDLSFIGEHYKSLLTKPHARQVAAAWEDLANSDARKRHQAVWRLIGAGDSATALVRAELAPAPEIAPTRVTSLIADIDHDSFDRRENASPELGKLLPQVRPELVDAAKTSSPETRRRIESLLDLSTFVVRDAQTLRDIRAVELLERIATREARALLKNLATGAPKARLTQEAIASLSRLDRGK